MSYTILRIDMLNIYLNHLLIHVDFSWKKIINMIRVAL